MSEQQEALGHFQCFYRCLRKGWVGGGCWVVHSFLFSPFMCSGISPAFNEEFKAPPPPPEEKTNTRVLRPRPGPPTTSSCGVGVHNYTQPPSPRLQARPRAAAKLNSAHCHTLSTSTTRPLLHCTHLRSAGTVLILLMRIGQGLGYGATSALVVYCVEHPPNGLRGASIAAYQLSGLGGHMAAGSMYASLSIILSPVHMSAWGWRLPYLLALLLGGYAAWKVWCWVYATPLSPCPFRACCPAHYQACRQAELVRSAETALGRG